MSVDEILAVSIVLYDEDIRDPQCNCARGALEQLTSSGQTGGGVFFFWVGWGGLPPFESGCPLGSGVVTQQSPRAPEVHCGLCSQTDNSWFLDSVVDNDEADVAGSPTLTSAAQLAVPGACESGDRPFSLGLFCTPGPRVCTG